MTGKTHTAVGIAAALLLTQPKNITDLTLCIGMSSIGSVICDVDVTGSQSHNKLEKIVSIIAIGFIALIFAEWKFNIGIMNYVQKYSGLLQLIVGAGLLLGICILGEKTPHRSFMHSLLGCFLMCSAVYIALPKAVPYFLIAVLSHIAIDLLNKKRVRILFPLKAGAAFKLCKSSGTVNNILFIIGSVLSILLTIICIIRAC